MDEPTQLFHFVIYGFHVFGNNFLSKENKYYIILHILFNYCIIEWPDNTVSVFDEGAIEHILGSKVWLYSFQSILWQVLF